MLPETILQFGSGRFLRAFADLFIHHANEAGQAVGRVVVVQSTGGERAGQLSQQGGAYHVLVRGLHDGQVIDRVEESRSISRALVAANEWSAVLDVARSPALKFILSNTTEAGYDLNPADGPDTPVPASFPAKLLSVLHERFRAGQPAPLVVPCELFEDNAVKLRSLLNGLAESWALPADFRTWLNEACDWRSTLVDRIVTGPPADHPLAATDGMMAVGEPYALWAIEQPAGRPKLFDHPNIVHATDIKPYFLRKVRILNAAHTALLRRAQARGFEIVRDAVNDDELGPWLERLLFDEIVPTLAGRVAEPEAFARQTLERFRNPFLHHLLADIAAHHAQKVNIRLRPTRAEFVAKFGKNPPLLDEVLERFSS